MTMATVGTINHNKCNSWGWPAAQEESTVFASNTRFVVLLLFTTSWARVVVFGGAWEYL